MHGLLIPNGSLVKLIGSCEIIHYIRVHECVNTALIIQDVLPACLWQRLLVVLVYAAKYVSTPAKC